MRRTLSILSLMVILSTCIPAAAQERSPEWANEPLPRSGVKTPPGRWQRARDTQSGELTEEQKEEIEKLESIGYLAGYKTAPMSSGVTYYDPERTSPGYNFYTSGHFPGALLVDMEGNVVHEWRAEFTSVFPDRHDLIQADRTNRWRYAHLYENGDVLGIYEGAGMVKLTADSEVVWGFLSGCHHDVDVLEDGTIYVLGRTAHVVERINPYRPILEDYFIILNEDGTERKRISILEAFERSRFVNIFEAACMDHVGDIFHTNAIEVLDDRLKDEIPAFREGNVLISIRRLDCIAVLDIEAEEIVWMDMGLWLKQHQPTVMDDGTILVFDNVGHGGASRVFQYDPVTTEITWSYAADPPGSFYTKAGGACHRLPNGNTLITESDNGRAFEVTPSGEIVWEYRNPERAGKQDELIATLFDVSRIPESFTRSWLEVGR
ncbi:MAG: hypothetical protein GF405_02070 [Candidatus Eisenbacteria bacterium]|nr:hypothetical protein [Candidatus Eisenbacteria bacterium]